MTRQTRISLRARSGHGVVGATGRKLKALVRRMRVVSTGGALWGIDGFTDGDNKVEKDKLENFENIGFASRPASGDNSEVITVKVGGESGHPVIIASRNRDAFRVFVDGEGLAEDETAIYTNNAMVKIKADGTIEAGSIGGTFQKLATLADLDELKAIFTSWAPISQDGGASLKADVLKPSPDGWHPTGTTKLRAE